jgi:hypothetical protein
MRKPPATVTVSDVRRKLAPAIRSIADRLNDAAVADLTGCGVKFTDYNSGDERHGIVLAMAFDMRTAVWYCVISEVPGGKRVRRKLDSVEVVMGAWDVANFEKQAMKDV